MIILPTLQSPYATEHPMLMDNALKIFIAIWNAEQFGSLGLAYFNFHDNEITALLQFNLAISFLSSYFPYAAMSYTGTWCFELIITLVRHFGVQLDHTIYNHAILGLWTAKSFEQTCTVMYGVLSHFGNVHTIKTCAILFADHSFMVKELLHLAELIQYCVDDANLSDASLLTLRMQDYYSINTKFDDTYLQNVSRYKLKIILGLCSVPLYASGSLRPKFFGYFTFLDFWKLVCLWNARRFGNLAFSLRVYAATYPATKVKFARIELRSCMASFMILFWNSKAWVNKQRKPLHANLTT
ncbi:hypothetical protein TB1_013387 [Malus domestica]